MNNDLIKQGAYYLLRGGTLLSEPCKKCGNLQIKYKDEVICMNCQHLEQDKIEQQETLVNDIESKKEVSQVRSDEDDKRTLNTFDNIQEVLSQVEHQVLQTLVELNKRTKCHSQSKKIQEIFGNCSK